MEKSKRDKLWAAKKADMAPDERAKWEFAEAETEIRNRTQRERAMRLRALGKAAVKFYKENKI